MTALSEADLDRLIKLCGLLTSTFPGERAVAAEKASEFLRSRKLTWSDVLRQRSHEPPPLPALGSGWRRIAMECLDFHEAFGGLNGWECGFLGRTATYKRTPSEKQLEILRHIAESVGVEA